MPIPNDIELHELKKKRTTAQAASIAVGAVDLASITALFAFFTREALRVLFEQTMKYVFFPLAAVASVIQAVLAWRQAQLHQYKKDTVVRAAVETAAAVAVVTAVGVGLFATATVAAAAPIIFTATLAAKTLFHAGSAMFYWGKSAATADPEKKADYRSRAVNNGVQAVVGSLLTAAVSTVLVFGKVALAGLGIAAGALGLTYLGLKAHELFKGWQGYQPVPADDAEESREHVAKPGLRSSADIESGLHAGQLRTNEAAMPRPSMSVVASPARTLPASDTTVRDQSLFQPQPAEQAGLHDDALSYRAGMTASK